MPSAETHEWLKAGIAAVKSGDKKQAHQLLLKVIEADERNEQAWLWLSAVVDSDADRRICLENVLALNPDSKVAKQGLASLDATAGPPSDRSSASGQAATLAERMPVQSAPASAQAEPAVFASDEPLETNFRDVWATEDDICAYCAARVPEEAQKCPNCGRSLITQEYRYAATASLHVYWVFLFTLALVTMFQALYQFRIELRLTAALLHITLTGTLMVLVVGVYFRLLWAHLASILVLILALILSGANFLQGFDPGVVVSGSMDPAFRGLATTFIGRLSSILKIVQAVIAGLSFFSAIFIVAPEFDRVKERAIARTGQGLHNAVDYHMVARRLAQEGKWASAVLHWQHAAALDRTAVSYQRNLAKAYLRLGFLERGLSVLQSAHKLPMQDATRSEIEQLLTWTRRQLASKEKQAEENGG